jgi:acetyl esterase
VYLQLCIKVHAAVMLVEYSLSPEVQFPIANEQIFAALCWLREHGKSINVNPDKISIAGDSAGGNMAAAISSKFETFLIHSFYIKCNNNNNNNNKK